jgi:hypothetical protein
VWRGLDGENVVNELSKIAAENIDAATMDREEMVTYPTEAFLSREYLQDEKKLLWPKIWQMVERETDLPNPGDWMTYDVAEESIIVLRKDDGTLRAFHNVCPHRGRQLVSVPDLLPNKVHDVRGNNRKNFICLPRALPRRRHPHSAARLRRLLRAVEAVWAAFGVELRHARRQVPDE